MPVNPPASASRAGGIDSTVAAAGVVEALDRGQHLAALCRLALSVDRQGSVAGLEQAFADNRDLLLGGHLAGGRSARPPRDRRGDEPVYRRILGDAQTMMLRLEAALPHLESDLDGLRRLFRLALHLGRPWLVRRLEELLPAEERLSPEARRRFLRQRALPQLPIGGDAERGFLVNEEALREIAAELGEPLEGLLRAAVPWMLDQGSRQVAKLYILACLSGDAALRALLWGPFQARARWPRANLPDLVRRRLAQDGGRVLRLLQEGDVDDYNPKSAFLFLAELGGERVVLKENLRLPLDFSRVDGYSSEREVLETISHPRIVRLRGVLEIEHHEILVQELCPGTSLAAHTLADNLLPADEALAVTAALAEALGYLHGQGILYLDVKAKNVLIERAAGPTITLLDFNMAQQLLPGRKDAISLLSTPAYVPPEMASRFTSFAASDVFQLGLLLYQLLVGRHPFAVADFADHEELRESQLVRYALANLHAEPQLDCAELAALGGPQLIDLLRAMLDKQPAARPTLAEVQARLQRHLASRARVVAGSGASGPRAEG